MEKHFTTSGFVFFENTVLLVKHKKHKKWLYPGGHIKINETPEEALIREIMEETGLNIQIIGDKASDLDTRNIEAQFKPFEILLQLIELPQNIHYHIDIVYLCTTDSKKLKINTNEIDAGAWFTLDELSQLEFFPNFYKLLKKAFNKYWGK